MLILDYRYLKCLIIASWVVNVFAPSASSRDTPTIKEIKSYHAQYKERLRKLLDVIHEIASLPTLTLDDKPIEQGIVPRIEDHFIPHQCRYIVVQLGSCFTEDVLILYLLEMFNVINKGEALAKEFLVFFHKLRDRGYFKRNQELGKLLVDIENEIISDDTLTKEGLRQKIKRTVVIRETTILEVASNIALKIQEKKKAFARNEIKLKLLDHILGKFLAFTDKVFQLLLLHCKWMKESVIAFVKDDGPIESDLVNTLRGLATTISGFETSKERICNKYIESLDVIFPYPLLPPGSTDFKAPKGTYAAIRECFDFCGVKLPFQHYSNFAEEVFRLDENFGLSSDST